MDLKDVLDPFSFQNIVGEEPSKKSVLEKELGPQFRSILEDAKEREDIELSDNDSQGVESGAILDNPDKQNELLLKLTERPKTISSRIKKIPRPERVLYEEAFVQEEPPSVPQEPPVLGSPAASLDWLLPPRDRDT